MSGIDKCNLLLSVLRVKLYEGLCVRFDTSDYIAEFSWHKSRPVFEALSSCGVQLCYMTGKNDASTWDDFVETAHRELFRIMLGEEE